jgi:23S rRNA pseudouridine1911/1915/1917 synthase
MAHPPEETAQDLDADREAGPVLSEVECRAGAVTAAQHGLRLDKVLVAMAPEFSRNHLQGLLEAGHVRLDGQPANSASRRVRVTQRIELELVPTEESRAFVPQAMALAVLYEDEHLLVLNKPVGLVVHPAPGHWSGTLLNGLLARHPLAATLPRAGIVHRLDKDTSGVMMVGKSLPAVTALSRAIAARDVKRRYWAIAQGAPQEAQFSADAPIGRDLRVRVRMAVVPVGAGGRSARTDFEVQAQGGGFCALRCSLHTGRTHQIRVHLQSLGLPLVGDELYGGRPALNLERQALHAVELELAHPITAAPLKFLCPPPPDFAQAWGLVQDAE